MAGSVGAMAVATSTERYQSTPSTRWTSTAAPATVAKVPSTPSVRIGDRADRSRPRADAHAAVEQDRPAGRRDDPLDGALGGVVQRRDVPLGDGGGDQEEHRRRQPDPLRHGVRLHREQPGRGRGQHQQAEGEGLGHQEVSRQAAAVADQASRHSDRQATGWRSPRPSEPRSRGRPAGRAGGPSRRAGRRGRPRAPRARRGRAGAAPHRAGRRAATGSSPRVSATTSAASPAASASMTSWALTVPR